MFQIHILRFSFLAPRGYYLSLSLFFFLLYDLLILLFKKKNKLLNVACRQLICRSSQVLINRILTKDVFLQFLMLGVENLDIGCERVAISSLKT